MEKPISVGDLVMVVRGHACTVSAFGGLPVRVGEIRAPYGKSWDCARCGGKKVAPTSPYVPHNGAALPLPWLKRIPPLDELEDVKRDETVTA